jgi:hypothetical protein
MRQKIIAMQKKAVEDTKSAGRSYMNLENVINEVLLKRNPA